MAGGGSLQKLLYCLGFSAPHAAGRQVPPISAVHPVAHPELAFGWGGSMYVNERFTNPAAGRVLSITIPDDCFYAIDATAVYADTAGAADQVDRLALEILDAAGVTQWSLPFGFGMVVVTSAGNQPVQPVVVPTLEMHLPKNAVVRWRVVDAPTNSGAVYAASIAIRMLYQDQM